MTKLNKKSKELFNNESKNQLEILLLKKRETRNPHVKILIQNEITELRENVKKNKQILKEEQKKLREQLSTKYKQ